MNIKCVAGIHNWTYKQTMVKGEEVSIGVLTMFYEKQVVRCSNCPATRDVTREDHFLPDLLESDFPVTSRESKARDVTRAINQQEALCER